MPTKHICLLIFDEAHKTTGKYAYRNIVELLEKQDTGVRIVALTATPVSKIENLPTIIKSLRSCRLEIRDETDQEIQ